MYTTKKVTWKSNIQSTFKFAAPHFPWLKFFTTLYLFIYFISSSCQKTPPFNHTKNFVRSHSNFRRLHSNICKQVKFYCKRIFMQINWKFEFQVYCHFRRVVSEYILQVKMRLKRLSWNGFFCQFIRTSEIRAYSLEKNYKANLRITFEDSSSYFCGIWNEKSLSDHPVQGFISSDKANFPNNRQTTTTKEHKFFRHPHQILTIGMLQINLH